jgi:serine/threonine protein phosphatase PrpC
MILFRLIIANLGDSRAVLCRDSKGVPLSSDHKASREDEKKRILAAGGDSPLTTF